MNNRRYLELVDRALAEKSQANVLVGHIVHRVIWETEATILFQDESRRYWRYLRNHHQAWPFLIGTGS
jgi:hypothetical protein